MPGQDSCVIGFIVGMSRGGTTWLAQSLNEHSLLAVFGESLYWGRQYVEPEEDGRYDRKAQLQIVRRIAKEGLSAVPATGADRGGFIDAVIEQIERLGKSRLTPGELFECISGAIAVRAGKRYVLEKTPHHLNWIGRILKYYPGAKFMILARDPYSFALSYKHQGDRKVEATHRLFAKRYHPLGCALVWRRYAESVERWVARLGAQACVVDLADIRRMPEATVRRVVSFLGIGEEGRLSEKADKNTSFPEGRKWALDGADIFWLNLVASRGMERKEGRVRKLGLRDTWSVTKSVLRLPVWAIYLLSTQGRYTSTNGIRYLMSWLRGRG